MKQLTFAYDCAVNDNEDYVKEGTKVMVADVWKQHEGFTPVIITEGYTYYDKPKTFEPEIIYFMNESFIELR